MRTPKLMVAGAIAVSVLSGGTAGASTSPHVVDLAGDANGLTTPYTHGGAVGGALRLILPNDPFGPGTTTEPASWAPGDLHSVRFSTVWAPGSQGPVPTGVRVHLKTGARPTGLPGGVTYVVRATVQDAQGSAECPIFFQAQFADTGATPTVGVQIGNALDPCVYTELLAIAHESFTVNVADDGLTMTFPLDALAASAPPFFESGTRLATPWAWVNVVRVGRTDSAPSGRTYLLGEDLPD